MRIALLGLTFIAVGCAEPDPGDGEVTGDETLREELARGATFEVDTAVAEATLRAAMHRAGGLDEAQVELDVIGGTTEVWTEGAELALAATIELGPIALPADLGPGDLTLVDVVIALDARCAPTWRGRDPVDCATDADVTVSWKLATGGNVHPLGNLEIADVQLEAIVGVDGVELVGMAPGKVWGWADVFEIGDVTLSVASAR